MAVDLLGYGCERLLKNSHKIALTPVDTPPHAPQTQLFPLYKLRNHTYAVKQT